MEIREYINPLLKWWWLIILSTVVAGGASFLATRQGTPMYASQTTLIIGRTIDNPNPSNNELNLSQQLTSTYVDLANRNSVREAAMEALGLTKLPEITVAQPNNSNTIEIIVTDSDPIRAQAVASELARQLILRSPGAQDDRTARQDFINQQLDEYEQAINETKEQISTKKEELGQLISARQISQTQGEIRSLEGKLQTLQSIYANLLQSTEKGATNTISILEEAPLPRKPIKPNNAITIVTAAAIGFVLAVVAAYILDYLDDTVKTAGQIEKLVHLPTLAGIAHIKSENESKLVTISEPQTSISEAYRILRTGIQFSSLANKETEEDGTTLLLTSAIMGEGKSTTAANLAVVLAQAGYRIMLLDADLRRPTQHRLFDLPNSRGLTTILLQMKKTDQDDVQSIVDEVSHPTQVEGLNVITCGPLPPNPSELLGSKRMKYLIEMLNDQFDYVLIDSPPVLSVTDAVILAVQADSTILVVKANKSRENELKHAVERLNDVDVKIAGCVLNSLKPRSEGYREYYYIREPYYSSSDDDGDDVSKPTPKRAKNGGLLKRFKQSHEAV